MHSFSELLQQRASTNHYDSGRTLSQDTIQDLIDQATRAPSAYNMQNWSFLVVHSTAAKEKLLPIAYGQRKVLDAAATIIINGLSDGHATMQQRFKSLVEQDLLPAALVEQWAQGANRSYQNKPQAQRDEAIRSASLAGMTLMLAAQARGLATGPMIGFDAQALQQEFGLSEFEIPAIMITLGYPEPEQAAQKPRLPASSLTRFV